LEHSDVLCNEQLLSVALRDGGAAAHLWVQRSWNALWLRRRSCATAYAAVPIQFLRVCFLHVVALVL
jgi:hypothetical protein